RGAGLRSCRWSPLGVPAVAGAPAGEGVAERRADVRLTSTQLTTTVGRGARLVRPIRIASRTAHQRPRRRRRVQLSSSEAARTGLPLALPERPPQSALAPLPALA